MGVSKELRSEIETYLVRHSHNPKVSENLPATMVSYAGSHGIPAVQDVQKLRENLPELPEKLQEFAFQLAMEPLTNKELANRFRVSPVAISSWKGSPEVQAHVAVYRYERQMLAFAKSAYLQNLAYDALTRVLKMRLTATTTETVAKTALKVIEGDYTGSLQASNYGRQSMSGGTSGTQFVDRSNTPTDLRSVGHTSIESVEAELEEIKVLRDAIGRDSSEGS